MAVLYDTESSTCCSAKLRDVWQKNIVLSGSIGMFGISERHPLNLTICPADLTVCSAELTICYADSTLRLAS